VLSRHLLILPVREAYLMSKPGEDRLPLCTVDWPLLPDGEAGSARRIVEESHGGTLRLASTDRGASFEIILP